MRKIETVAIGDILQAARIPFDIEPVTDYIAIGMKSFGNGLIHYPPTPGARLSKLRYFRFPAGALALSNIKAWEGAIGVTSEADVTAIASNRFLFYAPIAECQVNVQYLCHYFLTGPGLAAIGGASPGSADRNRTLSIKGFEQIRVPLPSIEEQRRIVDLIGSIDETLQAIDACARSLDATLKAAREALPEAGLQTLGSVLTGIDSGTSTHPVVGALEGEERYVLTLAAVRPGRFYPAKRKDVGCADLAPKALVREGDLLITRSNTPDKVGYTCVARQVKARTYMPDLIWRLNFDPARVSGEYLENVLSSAQLRSAITSLASGTSESMKKITKRTIETVKIPIPSLDLQEKYVRALRPMVGSLAQYDTIASTLSMARSAILSALMSGEHEIPESYDELLGV